MKTHLSPLISYTLWLAIGFIGLASCEEAEVPQLAPTVPEETNRTKATSINTRVADDFFPLAWYTGVEFIDALEDIKASGVNTVMPYIDVDRQSLDDLEAYMDQAHALGLKVCVQIPPKWMLWLRFADPDGINTRPGGSNLIRKFVERFRSHPALLSWYLFDEPNGIDNMKEPIQIGYALVKEKDTDHPVSMVFNQLPGAGADSDFETSHLSSLDILMFDYYPALEGYDEFASPRWPNYAPYVAQGASLASDKQGYWSVLQASASANLGFRLPTEAEERYMIYTSLVEDATGLFFYTYSRFRNGGLEWIDEVFQPLIAEFKALIPAITAGPLNTGGNQAIVRDENAEGLELQYRLFQDPNTDLFYLVVVNQSDQSGSATLGLQPGQTLDQIKDRDTDQAVTFTNQGTDASPDYVFEDTFAAYGVAVYELTAAPPVAGNGTVTVRAQGDCGSEVMELHVDGTKVDEWTVTTTMADYTYAGFGGGEVSVHFVNDSFNDGSACSDNNLTVDYISVCGTPYQAEEVATKSTDCCPWDQNKLYNNGNFNFGELACDGSSEPPTGAGTVTLRARGDCGSEVMELHVDGTKVDEWTVTTTLADYTYASFGGGEVSVRFRGDTFGQEDPNCEDSNLEVDYLQVCGTTYQTEEVATKPTTDCCPWDADKLYSEGSLDFGSLACAVAVAIK